LKRNQKQKEMVIRRDTSFHLQPKNRNQQLLLEAIHNFEIVVTLGSAGVGKTFVSASKVAQMYLKGGYDNIILSRANVPTGKSLGFFPGSVEEKLAPWLMPITSVLQKQFGDGRYQYLTEKKIIQMQPLETIRGRSFENALVLIDECQNLTFEEIKAITTRLGENSKMILSGDVTQSDVGQGYGITKFCDMCDRNGIQIPIIQFTVDDVVRSDIVGALVKMFVKENV
jgi:phosphate starvation-inducible protein PhoH and related proteins